MRRFALCLGMLLAWPLAGQAAKPAEPTSVEFNAGAWVDVDSSGKPHVAEMDTMTGFNDKEKTGSLADIVEARLRERIETWEFSPPTKNKVAVSGKTYLYISLEASDSGNGGIVIRILGAATGGKLVDKQMQGLIGAFMSSGELGGRVTVDVSWRDDGTVNTADAVPSSAHGKTRRTQVTSQRLLQATLKVAKTWRFNPEIVDGVPISGSGRVPVVFCWGGKCPRGETSEARDPGPEFTTLDPAIGLRTAVAGTVL